jgi:hypothetical protein
VPSQALIPRLAMTEQPLFEDGASRALQRNVDRKTWWIDPGRVDTSFRKIGSKPLAPWFTDPYSVFLYKYKFAMKPGAPSLQSTRLLDQVRERVRYMHYSLKTEKYYLY